MLTNGTLSNLKDMVYLNEDIIHRVVECFLPYNFRLMSIGYKIGFSKNVYIHVHISHAFTIKLALELVKSKFDGHRIYPEVDDVEIQKEGRNIDSFLPLFACDHKMFLCCNVTYSYLSAISLLGLEFCIHSNMMQLNFSFFLFLVLQ